MNTEKWTTLSLTKETMNKLSNCRDGLKKELEIRKLSLHDAILLLIKKYNDNKNC